MLCASPPFPRPLKLFGWNKLCQLTVCLRGSWVRGASNCTHNVCQFACHWNGWNVLKQHHIKKPPLENNRASWFCVQASCLADWICATPAGTALCFTVGTTAQTCSCSSVFSCSFVPLHSPKGGEKGCKVMLSVSANFVRLRTAAVYIDIICFAPSLLTAVVTGRHVPLSGEIAHWSLVHKYISC